MHLPNPSSFFSRQLPILLLLGIIALGTFARLKHAGDVPLCMDESWRIACLLDAENLSEQIFVGMNRTDPPLFNLLIYLLGKLYNVELVLRLASIIPGILAIPLAYLVARNLFSNRWLAVLSSFLTAFSMEIMVFSKELKPYSLCAFVHLCLLYGYLKYRRKITVRTTIVFTALLAFSIPLSLHSPFAFPGIFLALFAGTLLLETRTQMKLVLSSCIFLLIFSALCFFFLVGGVEDETHLNFMKGYWGSYFPPAESLREMVNWLSPRYVDHYSDIAFSNELAPEFIGDHLYLIYPALALLGFIVLLLRDRRRFFEAFCLFIVPLAVMFVFSMLHQWPFGRERMNLFVFFYILFPPLYILDELGKVSFKVGEESKRRILSLSPMASCVVCALICIQFPLDFKTFAHNRVVGCWQSGAQALKHILDIYPNGPRIPLVINYLGQAQFNYYSKYHRHTSARYKEQAELFAPRGLPSRNSSFYLRGTMLRICQEHRQAAIYLTHYLGPERMISRNDYCVEHDDWKGNKSFACLITSEIYDAARHKRPILPGRRFTGAGRDWKEVYRSPLLNVENAGPGALVVFNFDLDYHSTNRKIRLAFFDENDSAGSFDRPDTEYVNTVDHDHLETAACIRLTAPVDSVRLSVSAREQYDFTIKNLEYFVVHPPTWEPPDEPFRIVENMCERIKLVRSIRSCENFWDDNLDGFGWSNGNALIELDDVEIDPGETVLVLETYGRLIPEIREEIVDRSIKVYLNDNHRAPFIGIEGETAPKYYFSIPTDLRTVKSINIKTDTFVPEDLGLNDDKRFLGIDIKSIGFPRIVREGEEPSG